uniref:Uncharacterized protein n=1 Tax=Tolypothrix bouteillei VB521301 TaxID=1479485 RepID=A0A0C1NCG0_9CYAN
MLQTHGKDNTYIGAMHIQMYLVPVSDKNFVVMSIVDLSIQFFSSQLYTIDIPNDRCLIKKRKLEELTQSSL